MPSQKLVRCEVRHAPSESPTTRYIPMEVFGLWEFLMVNKHGFSVESRGASLWIDVEESPEVAYSEPAFERVTEITLFVYSEPDGMFSRICRYFPTEDYPRLKKIFLSHYLGRDSVPDPGPQIKEKEGIWIRRASTVVT